MNSAKLIRALWKICPKNLQESYDFCGKQAGELKKDIGRVLVCLDFDEEVFAAAEKIRPDLIIAHHPFFFGTPYQVTKNDPLKKELAEKIKNEHLYAIYSFHTCYDNAPEGMNQQAAKRLKLINFYAPEGCPGMRVGELIIPMSQEDFALYVMHQLNVSYALEVYYGKKTISKVALMLGGGASYYPQAIASGADVFISGDMSHHIRREIIARQFNYLDVPHESERIFIEDMAHSLNMISSSLEVICFDHEKEAKCVLRS